jgi:oxygen-independent coproporphyrinogen-3 oxidase
MYHFTKKFLAENGYRRYEISNYAREGFECRHNCGYWTGHEYLGLGLGASSDMGSRISPCGERFRNPSDMEAYRKAVREGCDPAQMRCERQVMTREDRMEEFMFLGLRMADGVSEDEFEARFGEKPEDRYGPVLEKHLAQGVIRRANRRIALTEFGMDVANYVMADYLL